MLISFQQP